VAEQPERGVRIAGVYSFKDGEREVAGDSADKGPKRRKRSAAARSLRRSLGQMAFPRRIAVLGH